MRRTPTVILAAALLWVLPGVAAAEDVPANGGVGLVDPLTGIWYLRDPATGATTGFYYGNPGDEPFTGDWDCDGVDTPGLYRKSDGYVYLRNSNTPGIADVSFFFGDPGDSPVAGDWDGDGCDTVSIYRPAEALFYVINRLGEGDAGLGAADTYYRFGDPGDQPFAGDFDGDGLDTAGIYRSAVDMAYLRDAAGGSVPVAIPVGSAVLAMPGPAGDGLAVRTSGSFHLIDTAGAAGGDIGYGWESHRPVTGSFGPLPGGFDPPPTAPPYPDVGSGKRIIYSNTEQRVWLIEADGTLAKTHPVSGRRGVPMPGNYAVWSKSPKAWAAYGGITMEYMVRFAHGRRLPYGFHSIPVYPDGRPLQLESELGTYQSAGCVRQRRADAIFMYEWAELGTPVHALP